MEEYKWDELSNEQLDKLTSNRLFGIRNKMSKIMSKVLTDYDLTSEQVKEIRAKAISYKRRVLHKLDKFGHIEKK